MQYMMIWEKSGQATWTYFLNYVLKILKMAIQTQVRNMTRNYRRITEKVIMGQIRWVNYPHLLLIRSNPYIYVYLCIYTYIDILFLFIGNISRAYIPAYCICFGPWTNQWKQDRKVHYNIHKGIIMNWFSIKPSLISWLKIVPFIWFIGINLPHTFGFRTVTLSNTKDQ